MCGGSSSVCTCNEQKQEVEKKKKGDELGKLWRRDRGMPGGAMMNLGEGRKGGRKGERKKKDAGVLLLPHLWPTYKWDLRRVRSFLLGLHDALF
jgi:hypothetical protein